ncbi:hypothetical protein N431DRAFT_475612 [Stipitochalara longipes BDJ]|nr:hypothetical protein N431DRAFT_475612 [Stipitochalara longipes BDJ]
MSSDPPLDTIPCPPINAPPHPAQTATVPTDLSTTSFLSVESLNVNNGTPDETPLAKPSKSELESANKSRLHLFGKMGKYALAVVVLSPLATIAAMSWSAFLWFANDANSIRHTILVQGWLTNSVTLCSLIVRTAEIINNGGSVAFAIQSIFTVLAGMAYYDQFDYFDAVSPAEWTYFVAANAPVAYRGFTVIAATLVLHLMLVIVIVSYFASKSRFSSLRTDWQAVAQLVTPISDGIVSMASLPTTTQTDIEQQLRERGRAKMRVQLGQLYDDGAVGNESPSSQGRRLGITIVE